jgi:hypothetical protein
VSHQPDARDKITNYTADEAGDYLINSVILVVLLFGGMIACSVNAIWSAGLAQHISPPMCDGKVMQPDDVCDVYINGQLDHTDTYEDRVTKNEHDATNPVIFSSIIVVVLFVIALFMIKRIRELAAVKKRIAQSTPDGPLP